MIAAEGEQKASKALKEASDIISESPAALQLRYYLQGDSETNEKLTLTLIHPVKSCKIRTQLTDHILDIFKLCLQSQQRRTPPLCSPSPWR